MPDFTLHTSGTAATEACGVALGGLVSAGDVLILSGELGAGKTHLTKGIAAGLGIGEPVTSPTFNMLLVHLGRLPLYHFDLYRLEDAEQLEDLDYWGTLEADGVSVVEWGDRFAEAVPGECLVVRIHITADDDRALEVDGRGERGRELSRAWERSCGLVPGVRIEPGSRA